jgi:putative uncharacterized protein gbs1223
MEKQFNNLDEQILKFKSRNLKIENEEKAKDYLLYNNYYNVSNYFGKFFMIEKDKYEDGTTFNNLMSLHHFDKEIKSIFFKYIIESEKHVKSIISYRYSEYYKDMSYPYLEIANYNKDCDILALANFISSLSNIIKSQKNGKNSISHYIQKYNHVPLWILTNYMTYGQISKFYSYIPATLKNQIAKDMNEFLKINNQLKESILTQEQLESYLFNIVEFRNVIAHNNKILDFKCKKNTLYNNYIYKKYNLDKNSQRKDVFNVFITLTCFLEEQEFIQLNNSLSKRINKLKKQVSEKHFKKILSSIGFPDELEKIQQYNAKTHTKSN